MRLSFGIILLKHATIWRLVYDSPHCRLCNSRQQVVKAVELGMGSIHGPAARGLIRAHETVTFHALLAAEAVESFRYGLKIKPPRPSGKACGKPCARPMRRRIPLSVQHRNLLGILPAGS